MARLEPAGRVSITWQWRSDVSTPAVEIVWAESGGPPVKPPRHRGFGRLVVERNLARSLEADVDLTFPAEGVRCRITIPAAQISRGSSTET